MHPQTHQDRLRARSPLQRRRALYRGFSDMHPCGGERSKTPPPPDPSDPSNPSNSYLILWNGKCPVRIISSGYCLCNPDDATKFDTEDEAADQATRLFAGRHPFTISPISPIPTPNS